MVQNYLRYISIYTYILIYMYTYIYLCIYVCIPICRHILKTLSSTKITPQTTFLQSQTTALNRVSPKRAIVPQGSSAQHRRPHAEGIPATEPARL